MRKKGTSKAGEQTARLNIDYLEKHFIHVECNKETGDVSFSLGVGYIGNRIRIAGLSREQTWKVWDAIRLAQTYAIRSNQRAMQDALGIPPGTFIDKRV